MSVNRSNEWIACVGHIYWETFHAGHDHLTVQVEVYKEHYRYYPEAVSGDSIAPFFAVATT